MGKGISLWESYWLHHDCCWLFLTPMWTFYLYSISRLVESITTWCWRPACSYCFDLRLMQPWNQQNIAQCVCTTLENTSSWRRMWLDGLSHGTYLISPNTNGDNVECGSRLQVRLPSSLLPIESIIVLGGTQIDMIDFPHKDYIPPVALLCLWKKWPFFNSHGEVWTPLLSREGKWFRE